MLVDLQHLLVIKSDLCVLFSSFFPLAICIKKTNNRGRRITTQRIFLYWGANFNTSVAHQDCGHQLNRSSVSFMGQFELWSQFFGGCWVKMDWYLRGVKLTLFFGRFIFSSIPQGRSCMLKVNYFPESVIEYQSACTNKFCNTHNILFLLFLYLAG
jgi:hypothetical protein